ncbi:MAG: hypothetical protein IPJ65_09855 [Archangiaceae bacterium]|nr:hypothetical protein [Archangiaceae bacterium]
MPRRLSDHGPRALDTAAQTPAVEARRPQVVERTSTSPRVRGDGYATEEVRAARPEKTGAITDLLADGPFEFRMEQGPNSNLFLQSSRVASHVVVSSEPVARAIASFPAGNSGVAVFAGAGRSENQGLKLTAGALREGQAPAGSQAISFELIASKQGFVLDQVVLDSLRSVREITEGNGSALELLQEQRERVAAPRIEQQADQTVLTLQRQNLDGKTFELTLHFPAGTRVEVREGAVHVAGSGKGPLEMRLDAQVPYPPMNPLPLSEMLSPQAVRRLEQLDPRDPKTTQLRDALRALQFLSFREAHGPDGTAVPYSELLAGSWRFQTYFGRDTMLTAMMLEPMLTPEGLEIALGSVLDRINAQGQVAHEEDIGPFAERQQLLEGDVAAAREQKPVFDYKMIDGEMMLPLLLERYAKLASPERLREVLGKPTPSGGTRLEALRKNVDFLVEQAGKYDGSPKSLLRILDGEHVGDWRDSNAGLGGGVYPGSVNVDLVPNALGAAARVLSQLGEQAPAGLEAALKRWSSANGHFEVRLSPEELRARLKTFLELPSNAGQRERLLGLPLGKDAQGSEVVVERFLSGATPVALQEGYSFTALALDERGAAVPVPNSDGALRMFLGDPPMAELEKMLPVLELPYPLGLMTPAGLLTANPALAHDTVVTLPANDGTEQRHPLTRWLDRAGYHGSVVWVWPQQMMQLGLIRQIERLAGEPSAAPVVKRMRVVLDALRGASERAGELAGAELYTFDDEGRATALTQAMGSETEANAAQLWSTVGPAVELAYQQMCEKLLYR